jgi:glycerol-3-phosphate acyltransferase PlsY
MRAAERDERTGASETTRAHTSPSALVVIGNCWPVFAQFRGGMGNASTGGCLLAAAPIAFVIGLSILVALTLILRHSARASLLTGLLMAPAFWLLGLGSSVI